jgi:hypothetical protein
MAARFARLITTAPSANLDLELDLLALVHGVGEDDGTLPLLGEPAVDPAGLRSLRRGAG